MTGATVVHLKRKVHNQETNLLEWKPCACSITDDGQLMLSIQDEKETPTKCLLIDIASQLQSITQKKKFKTRCEIVYMMQPNSTVTLSPAKHKQNSCIEDLMAPSPRHCEQWIQLVQEAQQRVKRQQSILTAKQTVEAKADALTRSANPPPTDSLSDSHVLSKSSSVFSASQSTLSHRRKSVERILEDSTDILISDVEEQPISDDYEYSETDSETNDDLKPTMRVTSPVLHTPKIRRRLFSSVPSTSSTSVSYSAHRATLSPTSTTSSMSRHVNRIRPKVNTKSTLTPDSGKFERNVTRTVPSSPVRESLSPLRRVTPRSSPPKSILNSHSKVATSVVASIHRLRRRSPDHNPSDSREELDILQRVESALRQLERENASARDREAALIHQVQTLQDALRLANADRKHKDHEIYQLQREKEQWKASAQRADVALTQVQDELEIAREEAQLVDAETQRLQYQNNELRAQVHRLDALVYGRF